MGKILVKTPKELLSVKDRTAELKSVVEQNPLIKDVDKDNYEQAKNHRTTLRTHRTQVDKEVKEICSVLAAASKNVKQIAADKLYPIILPAEEKQQQEIDKYEEVIKKEKQKEEEKLRDAKDKINEFCNITINDSNNQVNLDSLEEIAKEFEIEFSQLSYPEQLKEEAEAHKNRVLLALESRRRLLKMQKQRDEQEKNSLITRWHNIFNSKVRPPHDIDALRNNVEEAENLEREITSKATMIRDKIGGCDNLYDIEEVDNDMIECDVEYNKCIVSFIWDNQKESLTGQINIKKDTIRKREQLEVDRRESQQRLLLNKQYVELFGEYPGDSISNKDIKANVDEQVKRIQDKERKEVEKKKKHKDKVLQEKLRPYKQQFRDYINTLRFTGDKPESDYEQVNELVRAINADVDKIKSIYLDYINEL